jgi:hypothetical protein
MGERLPSGVWQSAEAAVVAGDVAMLDRLLQEHGEPLRAPHPRSSWCGGLVPDYSAPGARTIIAR